MNLRQPQLWSSAAKLLFLLSALVISAPNATAQTNIALAANKLNILYIGIDNPVTIAASGDSDKKVYVSSDDGEVKVE